MQTAAWPHNPWWLPGGHLQTIWAAKGARRASMRAIWQRQRWETPDDDFIDVDWLTSPETSNTQAPLLVLLHGLEGSTRSHYVAAFADMARQRHWRMAVPHFRGCSGERNRQPRAYHSGDWQEVDWIVSQMRACHAGALYVVGVSLGGNALMRWAGELAVAAQGRVNAVASICSPLDLVASGLELERGLNRWIYPPMFLHTMKPKAEEKWRQFPNAFDLQRAQRARTLYEFDDAFTAPLHGFAGVMDYWTRASAKPHMHRIAVPALALNACNDPFIPAASLPTREEVSPTVTLWQPDTGGHVGFTSGSFPGTLSAMPRRVADWLAQNQSAHHG